MDTQLRHPMLVRGKHDEIVRQQFVHNLRLVLAANIMPGNQLIYESRVKPAFERTANRQPRDRHEVRRAMTDDPYYRLYSATQRTSQELMWDSVIDSVEREQPGLQELASSKLTEAKGSCRTDSSFNTPSYHTAADIHLQPGGYHSETDETDLTAGAIYDRSVYIYAVGGLGDMNDDLGQTLVDYYLKHSPAKEPTMILDMGCAVGHSTLAWVEAFPEAKVYGIDCGGGMIRYAHARANHLGKTAHFSQQNAEKTDFADASFDVVCSHIMLHETSTSAFRNILSESFRLLKPGGLMIHLDLPRDEGMDPFSSFMMDWEAYHNNETFLVKLRDMDWTAEAVEAGFGHNSVRIDKTLTHLAEQAISAGKRPQYSGKFPILVAEK